MPSNRPLVTGIPVIRTLALGVALMSASMAQSETLVRIYELALENDPVLKSAEASYKASREVKNVARAGLLPQISASYGLSGSDFEGSNTTIDPTTGPETFNSLDDTESTVLNVDLRQNIIDLPAWFTFRQGKELSAVAEAQFAFDQQELIVRVAEAYFNVLRAKENLETAVAEETAVQRQLEQTEQRFEVGLIAITDVHESRAAHDLAVVTKLEAEGQLGIAYEALSVITGQDHSNIWLLADTFPVNEPSPAARADWVDFALENNYGLKAARLAENAAHQNSRSKRAEHYPSVNGSYSYRDSDSDGISQRGSAFDQLVPPSFDSANDGYSYSLNLELPIFSGGRVSAQRRQAAQEHIQAREDHIATQRNTIQNTRSLHLSVITDVGKVKARKQSITSAESALEATQAGYEVGTRNIVDVLDSQRFLFRALRDYSNARYDYVINTMRLKQQAGILNPEDIYDLNKWLAEPPAPKASTTPR